MLYAFHLPLWSVVRVFSSSCIFVESCQSVFQNILYLCGVFSECVPVHLPLWSVVRVYSSSFTFVLCCQSVFQLIYLCKVLSEYITVHLSLYLFLKHIIKSYGLFLYHAQSHSILYKYSIMI